MAIISISRGSFSGGKKLAECLAQKLNYHCIDREIVAQRAALRGASPSELLAALETPPTSALYTLNHRKYVYLVLVQAAIAEEISSGNAIYHGLVGHRLFQGGFPALRVRVIASLDYRICSAQERLGVGRPEAIAYIEKMDEQRRKWTRYLYGVDWEDPSLYDVVLNLQHIGIEQACACLAALIQEGGFDLTVEHRAAMREFLLASRVCAALASNPLTSNLEVGVEAHDGQVTIKGDLYEAEEEVQRVAGAVPGVLGVSLRQTEPVQAG